MLSRNLSVEVLKRTVSEHPDWPSVLPRELLMSVYMQLCEGGSQPEPLTDADCLELQNLIDLTRIHLRREAEEQGPAPNAGQMGRPQNIIHKEKIKVSIREDLLVHVDLILLDPVRQKLKYGNRSALIEELLLRWARERGFKN